MKILKYIIPLILICGCAIPVMPSHVVPNNNYIYTHSDHPVYSDDTCVYSNEGKNLSDPYFYCSEKQDIRKQILYTSDSSIYLVPTHWTKYRNHHIVVYYNKFEKSGNILDVVVKIQWTSRDVFEDTPYEDDYK